VIVLDSGPLGLLAQSMAIPEAIACRRWLHRHAEHGTPIVIPEIADYEVRRELMRLDAHQKLIRLDSLVTLVGIEYLPISTQAMRLAARFWADSRRGGKPTSDPKELDADVILAAQATLASAARSVIVATTNVRHLSRFVPAAAWRDIDPHPAF
jgi:predicted nucleic acid-binding protein